MKNKLSNSEQLLRNKLNEADFTYQEENWVDFQHKLAAGGSATFSPLIKGVAGFALLVGAVALINLNYSEDPFTTNSQPNNTQSKNDLNSSKDNNDKGSSPSTEDSPLQVNNEENEPEIPKESKGIILRENSNDSKILVNHKKIVKNKLDSSLINYTSIPQPTFKKPTYTGNFEIRHVQLQSPPCFNSPVQFQILTRGFEPDNIVYKWLINDQETPYTGAKIEHVFTEYGKYKVDVLAYVNEEFIARGNSNIISIEESQTPEFSYTDSKDIFTDNHLSFKVTNVQPGSYKWYANHLAFANGSSAKLICAEKEEKSILLEFTNTQGCVTKISKQVIYNEDFIAAFPKHFTPNNNGNNDEFVLAVFQHIDLKKYTLSIFNIENKLVFKTNNPQENWNGRLFNTGDILPKGTYAWTVEIENDKGIKRRFSDKIKILNLNN